MLYIFFINLMKPSIYNENATINLLSDNESQQDFSFQKETLATSNEDCLLLPEDPPALRRKRKRRPLPKAEKNHFVKKQKIPIFKTYGVFNEDFLKLFSYQTPFTKRESIEIIENEEEVGKNYDLRFDVVAKIKSVEFIKDKKTMECQVEFRPRPSGFKPDDAIITTKELKKYAPLQLCEFFETKILFPNK